MYLYGASGHAKVIIDILLKNEISITGIYDDNTEIKNLLNIPVEVPKEKIEGKLIIAIGNNVTRKKIAAKYSKASYEKAIHISAIIDDNVIINEGTVIMAGVVINANVEIGRHCIINTSASIDHDCIIEDYSHISPNATLCGNVRVGSGTHIGAGAVIIQGVTVGSNTIIGAGSVIINDVPNNVVVVGNPGKTIKY